MLKTPIRSFLQLLFLTSYYALSNDALANPTGSTVIAGQVTLNQNGEKLDIHVGSDKAIIDWKNFDIKLNEHTQFHQLSSSSMVLNRVNSTAPSNIYGKLTANGQVVIVNPNGILFGKNSVVDVGGLIASFANIQNEDFLKGSLNFDLPGHDHAKIINHGTITAQEKGMVVLLAPYVENAGTITAKLGNVSLKSGEKFSVDLSGDGMITAVVEKSRLNNQKVINSGRISAKGGKIELTAAGARELVDSLVVNTGIIEAQSLKIKNGQVILSAEGSNAVANNIEADKGIKGGSSKATNSGIIDVSGEELGSSGGTIKILGDEVNIEEKSFLNASGNNGIDSQATSFTNGGSINIGGGFQGLGNTPASLLTSVKIASIIKANGGANGKGGEVVVWSDRYTEFAGTIQAKGGTASGGGGNVEISGVKKLGLPPIIDVDTTDAHGGAGQLLFDPTDIQISSAVNQNVNGATPFSPNVDNGPSNLNTTTLLTALASNNVTVQSRATGAQLGNITVNDTLAWTANRSLTLDAHNNIIVNFPITARNNLTFVAGNDVILNANIARDVGGASLLFRPKTLSNTIGIAGGSGILNLSNADLAFVQTGWSSITFGSTTTTGAMNIGAYTWTTPMIFSTTGAMAVNGAQALGANSLTYNTNNFALNAALTGTGTFTLRQIATNIGLGLGTGSVVSGGINLDNTALAFFPSTFATMNLGLNTSTQLLLLGGNVNTWGSNTVFNSGSGGMTITSNQTFAAGKNLTINTAAFSVGSNSISGTGSFSLVPSANATIGLGGSSPTETIALNDTALNAISNNVSTWANMTFGVTTNTAALNLYSAGRTWYGNLIFNSGAGVMTVSGAQTMTTARNLTFNTNGNIALNAGLSGSSTSSLTFAPVTAATTMGLAGGTGTINFSLAELANITSGWSNVIFGSTAMTGATNLSGPITWGNSVRFNSNTGLISVSGAQTMGIGKNLVFNTNGDIALNAALSGSSTSSLSFTPQTAATTMGLAGGAGTINLTFAELANISSGWNAINFGTTAMTGAMTINANTWTSPVFFLKNTGGISVNGAQSFGGNNVTYRGGGALAFAAAVSGTGTLSIIPVANTTTMGISGGAGTFNVTGLNNIASGWTGVNVGSASSTAAMIINATTWNSPVSFFSNSGSITVAGAQNYGSNNATFRSSGSFALNSSLTGTGILSFIPASNVSVGLAGGAGTFNLPLASLNNIASGWGMINIGSSTNTQTMAINSATWTSPVSFYSGTGGITVAGAQSYGSNNALFSSNGVVTYNAAISGTGILSLTPVSVGTTIGLAGGTGTFNLAAASLNNIASNWSAIKVGATANTAAMTLNARTWNTPVIFYSGSGVITVAGAQAMAAGKDMTFNTDADVVFNANLSGSGGGVLYITPASTSTTLGVGTSAVGTINLSTTDVSRIVAGWTRVEIGRTDHNTNLDIRATSWAVPAHFLTNNNILLNGILTSTAAGTGTNFVLAAIGGNFTNTAGGSAINPASGRYITYSTNPASNTLNGITVATKRYNKTYAGYSPASVSETGNVFLYSIAPTLSASTNPASREYGLANPSFSLGTFSGFIDGDTVGTAVSGAAGFSTSATNTSNVNDYAINTTVGTLASTLGYQFSLTGGTLSITKAPLSITADNKSREYGLTNPAFTLSYGAFRNGEDSSVLDTLPTASTTATQTSVVNNYPINLAGGTDTNYNYTLGNGSLSVTKRNLTITADSVQINAGAIPTYSVSYQNFALGETSSVLLQLPQVKASTTNFDIPGAYTLVAAGALAQNYQFIYVSGTLTIVPTVNPTPILNPKIPTAATMFISPNYDTFLTVDNFLSWQLGDEIEDKYAPTDTIDEKKKYKLL